MRLHLITTGGTIEKAYREQTGVVENIANKLDKYLERLRLPGLEITIDRLMNKDSLEISSEEREQIVELVERRLREAAAPVVITHGTDTMVETGRMLRQRLDGLAVPVILTGAMTPLGFEASDGLQNLTESLIAARLLAPGIYVVMHNQVFPVDRVRKDKQLARFVALDAI